MVFSDFPPSFQRSSLEGKIAVVTGSTQGLGEATARLFIERGCKGLVLTGRNEERGNKLMLELSTDSCKVVFVPADLQNINEVRTIMKITDKIFGTLDILVNAAAVTDRGSLWDTTPEDYDRIMNVNAKAPLFLMQDAARIMEREKIAGSIINISSTASYGSMPMLAAYGMSKGALNVATKNAAYSLMWSKIRVNALAIGWMDTPGEDAIQRKLHCSEGADWKEEGASQLPFGRLLDPDEVARCIAFCASDESGMMTGCVIDFDQSVWGAGNAPVPPRKDQWARAHGMTFSFAQDDSKSKKAGITTEERLRKMQAAAMQKKKQQQAEVPSSPSKETRSLSLEPKKSPKSRKTKVRRRSKSTDKTEEQISNQDEKSTKSRSKSKSKYSTEDQSPNEDEKVKKQQSRSRSKSKSKTKDESKTDATKTSSRARSKSKPKTKVEQGAKDDLKPPSTPTSASKLSLQPRMRLVPSPQASPNNPRTVLKSTIEQEPEEGTVKSQSPTTPSSSQTFPSPNVNKMMEGSWVNSKRTPKSTIVVMKKQFSNPKLAPEFPILAPQLSPKDSKPASLPKIPITDEWPASSEVDTNKSMPVPSSPASGSPLVPSKGKISSKIHTEKSITSRSSPKVNPKTVISQALLDDESTDKIPLVPKNDDTQKSTVPKAEVVKEPAKGTAVQEAVNKSVPAQGPETNSKVELEPVPKAEPEPQLVPDISTSKQNATVNGIENGASKKDKSQTNWEVGGDLDGMLRYHKPEKGPTTEEETVHTDTTQPMSNVSKRLQMMNENGNEIKEEKEEEEAKDPTKTSASGLPPKSPTPIPPKTSQKVHDIVDADQSNGNLPGIDLFSNTLKKIDKEKKKYDNDNKSGSSPQASPKQLKRKVKAPDSKTPGPLNVRPKSPARPKSSRRSKSPKVYGPGQDNAREYRRQRSPGRLHQAERFPDPYEYRRRHSDEDVPAQKELRRQLSAGKLNVDIDTHDLGLRRKMSLPNTSNIAKNANELQRKMSLQNDGFPDTREYRRQRSNSKLIQNDIIPDSRDVRRQRKLQDAGDSLRPDEFVSGNDPYAKRTELRTKYVRSQSTRDCRAAKVDAWLGGSGNNQRRSYRVKGTRKIESLGESEERF